MRVWLGTETDLRRALQRGSKELHVVSAIDKLTVRDCANAEEIALTIGRLRRHTAGRFRADDIREGCTDQSDVVPFVMGDRGYKISVCDRNRDRRNCFLTTTHCGCGATTHTAAQRKVGSEKSAWPIAFLTQDSDDTAVAGGVIPVQAQPRQNHAVNATRNPTDRTRKATLASRNHAMERSRRPAVLPLDDRSRRLRLSQPFCL